MSWLPVFGVITVKRTSFRKPGVTSPSIALQELAVMFSSRTTHCEPRTSERTDTCGPSPGVAVLLEANASQAILPAKHMRKRITRDRILDMLGSMVKGSIQFENGRTSAIDEHRG